MFTGILVTACHTDADKPGEEWEQWQIASCCLIRPH